MKIYTIYAGVNGAGKSTLYQVHSAQNQQARINTDEIVKSFGDWKNPMDQMKAGKIAVARWREYIEKGISFSQETTLAGRSIRRDILKAKEAGYQVEMYYVGVDSAEIAKERVKERVSKGGHDIAEQDIERRYTASLKNLKEIIPSCDKVILYDNTKSFIKIATIKEGKVGYQTKEAVPWAEPILSEQNKRYISIDIKRTGFYATEKAVTAMERLGKQLGHSPTVKEVHAIYKQQGLSAEIKKAVNEVVKEFQRQELEHHRKPKPPMPER